MASLRTLSRALFANIAPTLRRSIASIDQSNVVVQINEATEKYPIVWLRDNCTCEKCFNPTTQSRITNWDTFNVDTKIEKLQEGPDKTLNIKWDDAHESTFSLDWLSQRSFNTNKQKKYLDDYYKPKKVAWSKAMFPEINKSFLYDDVMNSDEAEFNWIKHLAIYGVVLIEKAPDRVTVAQELVNKMAFIRKTHYGEDVHFQYKPDTNNVAFLTDLLPPHVDLPYYEYMPGINMLHCLIQTPTEGGDLVLTDVNYVAEILKKENKEVYESLTQTEVNWMDIGCENGVSFHKILREPMIKLDRYGDIEAVRHAIPQRDSFFSTDLDKVEPWYRALRMFVDKCNEEAALYKMKDGDILTFDNRRLIHGRLAYQNSPTLKRHVIGQFIDWDEAYCKMRVLQRRLEAKKCSV